MRLHLPSLLEDRKIKHDSIRCRVREVLGIRQQCGVLIEKVLICRIEKYVLGRYEINAIFSIQKKA